MRCIRMYVCRGALGLARASRLLKFSKIGEPFVDLLERKKSYEIR